MSDELTQHDVSSGKPSTNNAVNLKQFQRTLKQMGLRDATPEQKIAIGVEMLKMQHQADMENRKMQYQSAMAFLKMQHQSMEHEKDREHEAREKAKDREHATLEKEKARAHETEENEMNRQHEDSEKQAERQHVTDEKAKDREHEAAEGRKTRVGNFLSKYALHFLVLIALVVFLVVNYSPRFVSNVVDEVVNIEVPDSSKNYEGKDYLYVKMSLEDAGFKNIQENPKADLNSGFLDGLTSKLPGGKKDGAVESVSINGVTSFSKGESFPKNATVRITYHTYADNEE